MNNDINNSAFSPSLHNDCKEVIKTLHPFGQAIELALMREKGWYSLSPLEKQELSLIWERAAIRFSIEK